MHILIYKARGRSYLELPQRYFECGTVYRFEKSGVLHGLTRIRGFTQDDSHIFCTPEQLSGELISLLEFILSLLRDFGLTDFEAEIDYGVLPDLEIYASAESRFPGRVPSRPVLSRSGCRSNS